MTQVARFARSPQGRSMAMKAGRWANSPQGRARIEQTRRRLAARGGRRR